MSDTFTHKQMAVNCFNAAWDLLDLKNRTKEQEEQMMHLAHTSFWHWEQVEDHTPKNLSIGYWQLSRVYSSANLGERSLYYAKCCEEVSLENNIEPFYIAYAHEALSRANSLLGNIDVSKEQWKLAQDYLQHIKDQRSKDMLIKDLETIKW